MVWMRCARVRASVGRGTKLGQIAQEPDARAIYLRSSIAGAAMCPSSMRLNGVQLRGMRDAHKSVQTRSLRAKKGIGQAQFCPVPPRVGIHKERDPSWRNPSH